MKNLRFALLIGAFISAGAGQAIAGQPITQEELHKACGSLLPAARAQRIEYFKEYIRVIGSDPEFNSPDKKKETDKDLNETREYLARANDKKIPDAEWYLNWSQLGPGSGMLDVDMSWINEGRDAAPYRNVIERLSGSSSAKNGIPETLAGICALRAHVAALEAPDAPAGSPETTSLDTGSASLSQQQIAACSEEIKRTQVESQSWGGNINDVSARLGGFQKDLFEGRCAGHPEAQAYIAGANRMLGDVAALEGAGAPAGDPEPSGRDTESTESSSAAGPSSPKREKRQHVPDAVASQCLTLSEKPGFGGFVNSCPYKVMYVFCAEYPEEGAWSEAFDCDTRYGLGTDVIGANSTMGAHTKNAENIHWVACKWAEPNGKYTGIDPKDVKWDHQKRMLTFRCGE